MDVFVGSNLLSPLEVLKKYSCPDLLLRWSCHGSEEMVTNHICKIILKYTGFNTCSRIVIILQAQEERPMDKGSDRHHSAISLFLFV